MKYLLIITLTIGLSSGIFAQKTFDEKLDRYDNNAVIMFCRQDINEMPIWSKNNDYVGCNVKGDWIVFELKKARLKKTKLGEHKVGILLNLDVIVHIPDSIAEFMKESTNYDIRSITLPDSTTIQMKSDLVKSELLINDKSVMTLKGNCHSLSATLNGKYLAFISELEGLIVMRLKDGEEN